MPLTRSVNVSSTTGTQVGAAIYYLHDPTPGTLTLEGIFTPNSLNRNMAVVSYLTLSGVDTTAEVVTGSTNTPNSGTPMTQSVTLTVPADGSIAVANWGIRNANNSEAPQTCTFAASPGGLPGSQVTYGVMPLPYVGGADDGPYLHSAAGYVPNLPAGSDTISVSGNSTDNRNGLAVAVFSPLPSGPVYVAAKPATDISYTTARLNGNLLVTADPPTTQLEFHYGTVDMGETAVGWDHSVTLAVPNDVGAFATAVSSLASGSTYYYRIHGTNSGGEVWSGVVSFTTTPSITVAASPATDVTDSGATLNGDLTTTSDPASTQVEFYYGIEDMGETTVGWDHSVTLTAPNSVGAFSTTVSGLTAGTPYYYRTHGTNSGGESWSFGVVSFTTAPAIAVAASPATDVIDTMATLNGNLTTTNDPASTQVEFYYGTVDMGETTVGWDHSVTLTAPNSVGAFSTTVSGLTGSTPYYYRIHGTNSGGESWSFEVVSFTTLAPVALWTGADGGFWNDAANWNDVTPGAGSPLFYSAPGMSGSSVNDLAGASFASLEFLSGANPFTLSGNPITLTGNPSGNMIVNSSGNTQTIDLGIALGGNVKIDAAAGNVLVNGNISGPNSLTKIGADTWTATGQMGTSGTPNGQVLLKQGTTVLDGSGQLYTNSDFYVGQASGDNAVLTLKGNAILDTSNTGMGSDRIHIGINGSTGVLNVADSAVVNSGFDRYTQIGANGTINASGNANLALHRVHPGGGVVNITDNATFTAGGDFTPGGGTVFNISGGQLNATGFASFATTTFNISGGLAYLTGSSGFNGGIFDGVGIGGSPTFNLTGGTLQWVTSNPFVIKDSSQGGGFPIFFNVGGTGILKTPSYGYKGTGPYPQVTFNLNGGTWQPLANAMPANVALNVQAGGAKIDTSSSGLTIASGLAHDAALGTTPDGGLTKSGAGTLTLTVAGTYTGDTTVNGGTLALDTAFLEDTADVKLVTGAILNLNTGATDIIDELFIDGMGQAAGEWGAIGSGAAHESVLITGNGRLNVTTGSVATPYTTWAQTHITAIEPLADATPAGDPDRDGASNLAEFAFNGNPLSGSNNGQVHVLTADGSVDPDATKELILTCAVRKTAPAFTAGAPATATVDGITYSIQGSLNLAGFTTGVTPVAPITAGLPALTDPANYAYRSFSLDGSNGLAGKGFLRAKVTLP
ncbi:MAG: autotransporter-associated beta strand repeat-containing protein [Verrucomicrobia bacterium]|nr:autotransporter-associated beta strand repeat-containing protein [Verrucomicrobiota bacterium]